MKIDVLSIVQRAIYNVGVASDGLGRIKPILNMEVNDYKKALESMMSLQRVYYSLILLEKKLNKGRKHDESDATQ